MRKLLGTNQSHLVSNKPPQQVPHQMQGWSAQVGDPGKQSYPSQQSHSLGSGLEIEQHYSDSHSKEKILYFTFNCLGLYFFSLVQHKRFLKNSYQQLTKYPIHLSSTWARNSSSNIIANFQRNQLNTAHRHLSMDHSQLSMVHRQLRMDRRLRIEALPAYRSLR